MLQVQRSSLSMPSSLVTEHHLPHSHQFHLPQFKDFDIGWTKAQPSRGGHSERGLKEWPRDKTGGEAASSSRPSVHDGSMPSTQHQHFSHLATVHPMASDVDQNGRSYATSQHGRPIHSRQNSRPQPFYQSYYSARQPSPPPKREIQTEREQPVRRRGSNEANAIASYLQIPPSINNSRGSLPEFAAQVGYPGQDG